MVARYVQLYRSANTLVGNYSTNLDIVLAMDANSSGKQQQKVDHLQKLEEWQERGNVKSQEKGWMRQEKIVKFHRGVERGEERLLERLRRRKLLRKEKEERRERGEIGMMRTTRMNRCTTISLTTRMMERTLPITDEVSDLHLELLRQVDNRNRPSSCKKLNRSSTTFRIS